MVQHHITPATAGGRPLLNVPELQNVTETLASISVVIQQERDLLSTCRRLAIDLKNAIDARTRLPSGFKTAFSGYRRDVDNRINLFDQMDVDCRSYGTSVDNLYRQYWSNPNQVNRNDFLGRVGNLQSAVDTLEGRLNPLKGSGHYLISVSDSFSAELRQAR